MTIKARHSYQLHIQLCDIKPAVWRRIVVADNTSLAYLHRTIQTAMGWKNCHAYAFEIAGQRYGMPDADWPDDPTMDARRYTLGQLLQGQPLVMRYLYDFGDAWLHRIKLEAVTPIGSMEAQQNLPACISGRNACPPEDCGGAPGYAEGLKALQDPQHPHHKAARRMFGLNYDPKHVDLEATQAQLAAMQQVSPSPSTGARTAEAVLA